MAEPQGSHEVLAYHASWEAHHDMLPAMCISPCGKQDHLTKLELPVCWSIHIDYKAYWCRNLNGPSCSSSKLKGPADVASVGEDVLPSSGQLKETQSPKHSAEADVGSEG